MFGFLDGIINELSDILSYILANGDMVAFLIVAAIGIVAAIFVVTDTEPMRSAFYLALVFVVVAVVFFFLEAEFMAIVQLLVYVGAITILFAFSIMLTRRYIMNPGGDDNDD
jgi:NADH-quinone oxidoreductase subunit J